MVVTAIATYRSRETVAALEYLLERARRGEIIGLALCAKPLSGPEEIVFADDYRKKPGKALSAAMRMSWRLTQLADEQDARGIG